MINERQATCGITIIVGAVRTVFFKNLRADFIEQQRSAFDEFPDGANRDQLSTAQKLAKVNGGHFEPDTEKAEQVTESYIHFGVTQRLRGAYACYKADMQLECIRHILLALDWICNRLKWEKASAYLNEQNRVLLEMKRADEAA